MSEIAKDLQLHLSKTLQATIREHAERAALVLEPADTLFMMLQSVVDASCCAIASVACTLSQHSDAGEAQHLVIMLIEQHGKMLENMSPTMFGKISESIAAGKVARS